MAQKILIRRGSIGNIQGGGTVAVTKGELLYASGSITNTNVGDVIFISNETGNNFITSVGKLFTGTEPSTFFDTRFHGLPYYRTTDNTLYRIGDSTALNLTGNINNQTLLGMTVSGSFSGSFQGQFIGLIPSASTAISASFASTAATAFSATSASFAENARSASYANVAISASVAISSSYAFAATSASTALSAGTAATASFALGGAGNFSGSFSGSFQGDGSQLSGIAANLSISGSSGTGTVALKTQSLIITGSNGLSVSANGQTFAISIPSGLSIPQDLTVGGNLDVRGTLTYISSSQVDIGTNVIQLNSFGAAVDGGILVLDASGSFLTGSLLWNSAADYWYGGVSGSTQYRFTTYDSQNPTTNAITKVDSNKRLVASNLSDTGTAVSSSVPLSMGGNSITELGTIAFSALSASAFVHTNGNKELQTILPVEAGSILIWTGTAFTASRVLDGGLF